MVGKRRARFEENQYKYDWKKFARMNKTRKVSKEAPGMWLLH